MSEEVREESVVTEEPVTKETSPSDKPKKKKKSKVRSIIEWVFTGIFAALFIFFGIGHIIGIANRNSNYGQTLTYDYGAFIIGTNSMEPEYKVATAIITKKDSPESIVKAFESGKKVDITFYCRYVANFSKYDYVDYTPEEDVTYNGITYTISGHQPVYPKPGETQIVTHRLIDYYVEPTKNVGEGKYTFVLAGINLQGDLSKAGQYQLITENELLGVVKVNSPVLGAMFRFITTAWGLLIFLLIPAFYLVITSVIDIFKVLKESEEGEATTSEIAEAPTTTSEGTSSALEGLSKEDLERLKKEMLEEMMNKKGGK